MLGNERTGCGEYGEICTEICWYGTEVIISSTYYRSTSSHFYKNDADDFKCFHLQPAYRQSSDVSRDSLTVSEGSTYSI